MSDQATIFAMLILYKVICVLVGLAFAYLGYRLFLADKVAPAGDLNAESGKHKLSLRAGSAGTFFSLFGAAVIAVTIFKGAAWEQKSTPAEVPMLLPEKLPEIPQQKEVK